MDEDGDVRGTMGVNKGFEERLGERCLLLCKHLQKKK